MKILTTNNKKEFIQQYTTLHPDNKHKLYNGLACSFLNQIENKLIGYEHIVILSGISEISLLSLFIAKQLERYPNISSCDLFIFDIKNEMNFDYADLIQELANQNHINIQVINHEFSIPEISKQTLIIDALFEGDLEQALKGGFSSIVKLINASSAYIVSIETPSGLFEEDNTHNIWQHIVKANQTFALFTPTLSQILPDNDKYIGQLKILHFEELSSITTPSSCYEMVDETEISILLKKRNCFAHKGNYGHALIISGQKGAAGSGILASRACLRSGVGKITIHSAACNNSIFQIATPEALFSSDESEEYFSTSIETHNYDAIAIGPGIGTSPKTAMAFIEQIRKDTLPTVIDADGINILAHHKGWINQIPINCILTPHVKEMQRLTSVTLNSYQLLQAALQLAKTQHIFIILKGHYSAICTPKGKVYFNTTGNPGMATAGSGDVLTGIVTALLAQKYTPLESCLLGTYLHGKAGDLASKDLGEYSMIASDIINYLPHAFINTIQ